MQIDPFADTFTLESGQFLIIVAHPENGMDVLIEIEESAQFKNVWLPNNSEYFY